MISVTDLKRGTIFEDEGQVFVVLSYEHIKLGRGSATIKVKVKNVKTGATTEKGFINGARVQDVFIIKKELQFLYKDLDTAHFMNPTTFEQIQIPLSRILDNQFLKEEMKFMASFLGDEPLSFEFPPKMEFIVAETDPGVKGNSATNIYKDAILENGFKTKVPLFIKEGDSIKIDTRTGEYAQKS